MAFCARYQTINLHLYLSMYQVEGGQIQGTGWRVARYRVKGGQVQGEGWRVVRYRGKGG